MQTVREALDDVKDMYQKVVGQPAPDIEPHGYAAFPPGVDPVAHTIAEVDYLKQLSEQINHAPIPATWVPPADSFITDEAFLIRVEVAGIAREDLKVLVVGGECVVRGERKRADPVANMKPTTLERPWGPFERRFALPAGSVADKVTARYQDGVLELRIAIEKAAIPKETKIDVV